MTKYVALLRGIMPMNPNMKSGKLKEAFETMGFKKVETVIASGNVIFESVSKDSAALEKKIEKALPELLGFNSSTIVRSKEELEKLAKASPFITMKEDRAHYLIITFLKNKPSTVQQFPHKEPGFTSLSMFKQDIFSVINLEEKKTPDFMRVVEKKFGKEITTRTWKTLQRILKKME